MLIFFLVALTASVAGAICGIGGGVIIKPTLDLFGWVSVSTISFLSGCYCLVYELLLGGAEYAGAGESKVKLATGTPLAIGAAVGGIVGKQLFSAIKAAAPPSGTGGERTIRLPGACHPRNIALYRQ